MTECVTENDVIMTRTNDSSSLVSDTHDHVTVDMAQERGCWNAGVYLKERRNRDNAIAVW